MCTYAYNIIESPKIGQPAITSCEIHYPQVSGIVPSLFL